MTVTRGPSATEEPRQGYKHGEQTPHCFLFADDGAENLRIASGRHGDRP